MRRWSRLLGVDAHSERAARRALRWPCSDSKTV
jgi:hypothetical protein